MSRRWTEKDLIGLNVIPDHKKPVRKKKNKVKKVVKPPFVCTSHSEIEIEMSVKIPSLNEIYRAGSWDQMKVQKSFHQLFAKNLSAFKDVRMEYYSVMMTYNSGLDTDNTVYGLKMFIDTCVQMGIFPGDTKKNNRGVLIIPDERLPMNTYKFKIKQYVRSESKKD